MRDPGVDDLGLPRPIFTRSIFARACHVSITAQDAISSDIGGSLRLFPSLHSVNPQTSRSFTNTLPVRPTLQHV